MTDDDMDRFAACALTCLGGSEQKGCACTRPIECEMQDHPRFAERRVIATRRLVRDVKRAIVADRNRVS